jgi:hypothetical protein
MRLLYKYLFLILIFLLVKTGSDAQITIETNKTVYQLSGMVISHTSGLPVPYAKVRINHTRRGIVANDQGFYSMPVISGDTLYITSVGYKKITFIIKDYLEDYLGEDRNEQYIYAVHYAKEDSIVLPTVLITPYDTPEKIKTAMLAQDIEESLAERQARENLNPAIMKQLMETTNVDEGERIEIARRLYFNQYGNNSVVQNAPIFNPIAIARYVQYLSDRSRKKKEKIYNYWPE